MKPSHSSCLSSAIRVLKETGFLWSTALGELRLTCAFPRPGEKPIFSDRLTARRALPITFLYRAGGALHSMMPPSPYSGAQMSPYGGPQSVPSGALIGTMPLTPEMHPGTMMNYQLVSRDGVIFGVGGIPLS